MEKAVNHPNLSKMVKELAELMHQHKIEHNHHQKFQDQINNQIKTNQYEKAIFKKSFWKKKK